MNNYEKLGLFYLGQTAGSDRAPAQEYLYDSKDLTTHAVIVGMTGSGKTGLGVTLLEEAAIDGIPVIAIDPKGDLGNLLLTFPQLRADDFRPWVDPAAASVAGRTIDEQAAAIAEEWRRGLAESGQSPDRINRFADAADRVIYTPGSSAGLPLSVLKSFAAPPPALVEDAEALRDRISSSASGLLSLVGVAGDPLTGREHLLVGTILEQAWRGGRSLDVGELIRAVHSPPFQQVGVFDLETFFPAQQRMDLAMRLNTLIASPGFAGWREGEPLDVARLLHTPEGRPRVSILSIAHLSESERMFFVTLLLGEVLAWVRKQPGTSSLRAILYMDEVMGYFPPVGEPPSKRPMLTLLKQARAYGLGVVLATQNPVDLDYKGLSNAGTWFLGRLQTERDKARVLEGLEGASATAGAAFDRAATEATLAGLAGRTFLVNNVHENAHEVIRTRCALSYLRGPLTREQIATLMSPRKAAPPPGASTAAAIASEVPAPVAALRPAADRPVLPHGIEEHVLPVERERREGATVHRAALLGRVKLHFVKSGSAGIDSWVEKCFLIPVNEEGALWDEAEVIDPALPRPVGEGKAPGAMEATPASLLNAGSYKEWTKALKDFVYRTQSVSLWKCASPKATSEPGETEGEFRVRIAQQGRETRDAAIEKLRKKYAVKLAAIEKRIRTAELRVEREQGQATRSGWDTLLSMGSSLFGALLGRKKLSVTNVGRAATAARSAGRTMEQRSDVTRAEAARDELKEEFDALKEEVEAEAAALAERYDPQSLELEEVRVPPRKSDTQVEPVGVVWCPWTRTAGGIAQPAWKMSS